MACLKYELLSNGQKCKNARWKWIENWYVLVKNMGNWCCFAADDDFFLFAGGPEILEEPVFDGIVVKLLETLVTNDVFPGITPVPV